MLLYEDIGGDLDILCEEVAGQVELYLKMIALLTRATHEPHVQAIVVTCGLRKVWEKIPKRNSLTHVKVIDGGKIENGCVVTPDVKGVIATQLKSQSLRVLAFGDSPLDIEMLKIADEANIMVGEESTDNALSSAISTGLSVHQILLPSTTFPRLPTTRLPTFSLSDPSNLNHIFHRTLYHATSTPTSKLL